MYRIGPVLGVLVAVTVGCGEVGRALNKGGDTTCGVYLEQDAEDQRTTITKFLEERRRGDAEFTPATIDVARGGVNMLCSIPANTDVAIRDATFVGKLDVRVTPTR